MYLCRFLSIPFNAFHLRCAAGVKKPPWVSSASALWDALPPAVLQIPVWKCCLLVRKLTNCFVPLSFGWYAASPLILPKCNSWVSVLVVFDHGLEDLSLVVLCGIRSYRTQSQHVAATCWLIGGDPVAIIDAERLVTSVSPSTLLEAPLSKSGSWSPRISLAVPIRSNSPCQC